MSYIQGENRNQMTLEPLCLDDYIGEDSVCRVIDAYVSTLDMSKLGFKYAEVKQNGRPPYDPASMLKLYVYGYMNRVRSSRRLEAETQRNIEVMWLLEKLTPDDKTICNFRKDNPDALKKAFREFSLWCSNAGLYGKELIAVDGTKIRANTNRSNIHTKKGTEKRIAETEAKIEKYMRELEENDNAETDETKPSPETVREILKHLNEKKEILTNNLRAIEENDGREISTVDPDARIMHTNGDGRNLDACYNVQTVADEKHKLIVDFEVTNCPDDSNALPKMTEMAKEIMEVNSISVVADKGYYDPEDIADCEKNGTVTFVPKVADYAHAPDKKYDKSNFKYDSENDCYICPESAILTCKKSHKEGRNKYANRVACKNCKNREKCTTAKFRTVQRTRNQGALDRNNARMNTAEGRELFRERKKIVEHPFGTIKAVWGFRNFLCRTKERTTAEQSLAFLAYNLRRVINIFRETGKNLAEAMV
ncbi:transposase [Clostridia bacterium]|nr:transposase [Clostridia bacterium]